MNTIVFGCSVTNKLTSGSYNYFLYSRIDNYAVIMRVKTDDSEYLFRVILQSEDVATVWASAVTKSYLRPDAMSVDVKRYVTNKSKAYKNADLRSADQW